MHTSCMQMILNHVAIKQHAEMLVQWLCRMNDLQYIYLLQISPVLGIYIGNYLCIMLQLHTSDSAVYVI